MLKHGLPYEFPDRSPLGACAHELVRGLTGMFRQSSLSLKQLRDYIEEQAPGDYELATSFAAAFDTCWKDILDFRELIAEQVDFIDSASREHPNSPYIHVKTRDLQDLLRQSRKELSLCTQLHDMFYTDKKALGLLVDILHAYRPLNPDKESTGHEKSAAWTKFNGAPEKRQTAVMKYAATYWGIAFDFERAAKGKIDPRSVFKTILQDKMDEDAEKQRKNRGRGGFTPER